ncbi:unnamed protein product [Boreogadus saida]
MELNGSQSAPDPPRHEAIHRAVVQRGCSHIPGVSRMDDGSCGEEIEKDSLCPHCVKMNSNVMARSKAVE